MAQIRDRPDSRPIAWGLKEIARSPGESQKLFQGARAAGLRHLLGFLGWPFGIRRKWGLLGAVGGVPKYATPRISGRLRMIFRKSRDFPPELGICFSSTIAVDLRHLLGFLGICRNSAKTGPTWRGWGVCVCDPPGPWPIAFALQESARFRGESQKLTHVPARRACSIYTDFSGPVGIR